MEKKNQHNHHEYDYLKEKWSIGYLTYFQG